MVLESRFLSQCPRVKKSQGRLIATTNWRLLIFTLGLYWHQVVVDPGKQVVLLRRRYAWFFWRGIRIPFRSIKSIDYGYQELNPAAGWAWSYDSADWYTVRLRLNSGKELHLFHFHGDGHFTNDGPLPDWFYWPEYATDMCGTQERESRLFVEVVSKMIGVPVDTLRW
jgi:hypothetical protein